MKFFHLSHIDLDGYTAQLISKFYLKNGVYLNSNYGKEIESKFEKIVFQILDDEKALILITDLNLTLKQCADFENALKDKKAKILVLDHHITGLECAKKYPWYFLDNSRCATKITYDFFSSMFCENKKLSDFVDVVNSVDIWLDDRDEFELGKVCSNIVSSAKELNKVIFEDESFEYILFLIQKSMDFVGKKDSHILLDDSLHFLKKEFFKADFNDTLTNLVAKKVVTILSNNLTKFEINYKEFKGILTYNIGNMSIIGNEFLKTNPQYDFIMDITSKKSASLRANGKCDVSLIAQNLFNGGGHTNASGGAFLGFRDSYDYDIVKNQIIELIAKKTEKKI